MELILLIVADKGGPGTARPAQGYGPELGSFKAKEGRGWFAAVPLWNNRCAP